MFSIVFLLEAAVWFLIIGAIIRRVTSSNKSSKGTGRTPDYQTYYKNQGTNMQPKEQRVTLNYQAPQQRVAPNYQAPQQRVTPNHQAPQQRVAPNVQQKAAKRQITPEERKKLEQYRAGKEARPQILERAASNAAKYKENQTLQELESEHRHTERSVSIPQDASQPVYAGNTSLLGNIEDLMVKGYDGELSFERDFVAEALDMINSFI